MANDIRLKQYNEELQLTPERFPINPLGYEANRFQTIYEDTQKCSLERMRSNIQSKCDLCEDSGLLAIPIGEDKVRFHICCCPAGNNIYH